jgi:hypothetical protein
VNHATNDIDHLRWFFVPDGTPFLPVSTSFNSLDWRDRKERDMPAGYVGEVPGTRVYEKSRRNLGANAQGYCGDQNAFRGIGGDPTIWGNLDWQGMPVCCSPGDQILTDGGLGVTAATLATNISATGSPFFPRIVRSSSLPYEIVTMMLPEGANQVPWKVDLLNADPGTPNNILDCTVCDFPGYAQQDYYAPIIAADVGGFQNEAASMQQIHFECSALNSNPLNGAVGYVVSDLNGTVLFFEMFPYSRIFHHAGDYLDISSYVYLTYDYP